jgi:hypothetical protein
MLRSSEEFSVMFSKNELFIDKPIVLVGSFVAIISVGFSKNKDVCPKLIIGIIKKIRSKYFINNIFTNLK